MTDKKRAEKYLYEIVAPKKIEVTVLNANREIKNAYIAGLKEGRKELEKENAELKAKLYSDSKNVFAELNEETARSNAELLDLVEDLKAQIEKMKMVASSWIMSLEDIRASEVNNRRLEVIREFEKRVNGS